VSPAFELLFYQIQALAIGDQLVALAALAATLVYGYRLSTPWLAPYLHLETKELVAVWLMSTGLSAVALLLAALEYPP
jgi:cell division protein FtsX